MNRQLQKYPLPLRKEKMQEIIHLFDPVSNAEIAEIMGVTRQKVSSLHFHNKLPKPYKVLKCGPLWDKKEITNWLKLNNMIKKTGETNESKNTTTTFI